MSFLIYYFFQTQKYTYAMQNTVVLFRKQYQQHRNKGLFMSKLMENYKSVLKQDHYFQKGFLRPVEIKLFKPTTGLPQGFNLVQKTDISECKYSQIKFPSYTLQELQKMKYDDLIKNGYDNLLCAMKANKQIQLAICVCMYSQDKKMLKYTLQGINENITNFVLGGIRTDQIAVFVVMDGIEKVDDSIVDFFDQLERESNIMLADDIPVLGLKDMIKTSEKMQNQQTINISNAIYDPAELYDRKERRFRSRVQQYKNIRKLQKKVADLLNQKNLTYEELDKIIQKFFIDVAKESRRKQFGIDQDDKDDDFYIREYTENMNVCRPLIQQALVKTRNYCDQYIRSRNQLALLNFFQTQVFVPNFKKKNRVDDRQGGKYVEALQEDAEQQRKIQACKMNLFLCTKYQNSGKLSSHSWFFNGFCKELNPKYAVLLDVGLKPDKNALYKMYKHLAQNPKVGGVCGYMNLKIQRAIDQLGYYEDLNEEEDLDCISRIGIRLFDIQRAQQMQYHMAHLLDKPFQSIFKFIHVLPGAFSAYNMQALKQRQDSNLLAEYFRSIQDKLAAHEIVQTKLTAYDVVMRVLLPDSLYYYRNPIHQKSQEQFLYNQNVNLAEDRILCMGIHKNNFDMAFIPDAYAYVDPIKSVHGLLGQRKRWINGSFFAFDKVKKELAATGGCQIFLWLQIYFLTLMNSLAYLSPSLFLFTVSVAMQAFKNDVLVRYFRAYLSQITVDAFVYIVNFSYAMLITGIIFFSMFLTNKHKKFIPYIYVTSTVLGIFSFIVLIILAVDIIRGFTVGTESFLIENKEFVQSLPVGVEFIFAMRYIIIGVIVLYGVPILFYTIVYCRFTSFLECLFSIPAFAFFSATYLNILNIYALSRINDISWGTKGLDAASGGGNSQLQQTWKVIRTIHVAKYLFWNVFFAIIFLSLGSNYTTRLFITFTIMCILAFTLLVKVVLGIIYLTIFRVCHTVKDPTGELANTQSTIHKAYQALQKELKNDVQSKIKQFMQKDFESLTKNNHSTRLGFVSRISFNNQKKADFKSSYMKFTNSRIQNKPLVNRVKKETFKKQKNKSFVPSPQNTKGNLMREREEVSKIEQESSENETKPMFKANERQESQDNLMENNSKHGLHIPQKNVKNQVKSKKDFKKPSKK